MTAAAINSLPLPRQPSGKAPSPSGGAFAGGQRGASPSHRPSMHDADAARGMVFAVIKRIEGYLDEETNALDLTPNFDLKASNDRKSQGLLDLNQALRRLRKEDVNKDVQMRLNTFRNKLSLNLRKIQLHLDAVKEITAMLSDAIQSAESDGTYTRQAGPYRSAF
jgi:hypothetical protein